MNIFLVDVVDENPQPTGKAVLSQCLSGLKWDSNKKNELSITGHRPGSMFKKSTEISLKESDIEMAREIEGRIKSG